MPAAQPTPRYAGAARQRAEILYITLLLLITVWKSINPPYDPKIHFLYKCMSVTSMRYRGFLKINSLPEIKLSHKTRKFRASLSVVWHVSLEQFLKLQISFMSHITGAESKSLLEKIHLLTRHWWPQTGATDRSDQVLRSDRDDILSNNCPFRTYCSFSFWVNKHNYIFLVSLGTVGFS